MILFVRQSTDTDKGSVSCENNFVRTESESRFEERKRERQSIMDLNTFWTSNILDLNLISLLSQPTEEACVCNAFPLSLSLSKSVAD